MPQPSLHGTVTQSDHGEGRVKTVETSLLILEYLKKKDGATTNEIVEEFGYSKSTIHRHLTTLNSLEFLVKEKNTYYPSLKFLDFGQYTRKRKTGYEMARSKIKELANETNEHAQFLVEEHGRGIYLHRAVGSNAEQSDASIGKWMEPSIGKWSYLNTTAAGKAVLAHLSPKKIDGILEKHGLPAVTDQTISSREELFEELETIRERGYSFNHQENVVGLRAVGAPVIGPDDDAIGAFSVAAPTHRMKGNWFEEELPELLLGVAKDIELEIIHS